MARLGVTVKEIVDGIGTAYPYGDAEEWDKVGLLVGDESALVTGIVFALEPRFETIEYARQKGANVIVTHHPCFVAAPAEFTAYGSYSGRILYAAARAGISLINAHTNLDVSEDARHKIGDALGLIAYREAMEATDIKQEPKQSRYAVLWQTSVPRSLAEMARLVRQVYKVTPRIYGEPQKQVISVMTSTGAGSEHVVDAIAAQADLYITGEVKYHDAMAAKECGVAVIELGHDISEWPLVSLLKEAVLAQTFMSPERLFEMPAKPAWWTETGEVYV